MIRYIIRIIASQKVSPFIFLFLLFGCSSKRGKVIDLDIPPPPPPPSVLPSSAPPNFIPPVGKLIDIQVNPIPAPFNLDGSMPYAIWVNGKLLPMSPKLSTDVARALNLNFTQPKDTAKIHNGEGWLYPLKVVE